MVLPKQHVGGEERTQDGQQNETPPNEPTIDRNIRWNRTTLNPRFLTFVLVLLAPSFDRGIERVIPVVHLSLALASALRRRMIPQPLFISLVLVESRDRLIAIGVYKTARLITGAVGRGNNSRLRGSRTSSSFIVENEQTGH